MKAEDIVRSACRPISVLIVTCAVCWLYIDEGCAPDVLEIVWQIMMGTWFGERLGGKMIGGYARALKNEK